MSEARWGAALVLVAASLWGTLGPCFAALGNEGVGATEIAIWRAGLASLSIAVGLGLAKPRALLVRAGDLPFFLAYALVSVALFFVIYPFAVQHSSVAVAVVLLYTAPAWVAGMAYLFFREPITRAKLGALALCFSGAALVAGLHDATVGGLGIGAGLLSGLTYATLGIFGKAALHRGYSSATTMLYALGLGCLMLLAYHGLPAWPGPHTLILLLYAGLVPTTLSFLCYTWGLQRLGDAGKASLLATIEPVVGMTLGFLLLHQTVSSVQLLGAALILGGVVCLA